MQFCLAHKLSYAAISELLKLLQLLCPSPNRLPTTVYQFKKYFNQFQMPHVYSNICSSCQANVEECRCDHQVHNGHLITIPLKKQLNAVISGKIFVFSINLAFRKENFGQGNFGESLTIHQIHQDFLSPKFCIVRYILIFPPVCRSFSSSV